MRRFAMSRPAPAGTPAGTPAGASRGALTGAYWKRAALRLCRFGLGLLLTCSTALAAILLLALLSLTLPNLSLSTVMQTIRAQVTLAQEPPTPAPDSAPGLAPAPDPAPEPASGPLWAVAAEGGGYRLLRPALDADDAGSLLTGGGYRLRPLPAAPQADAAPAFSSSEAPCCCQYLAGACTP